MKLQTKSKNTYIVTKTRKNIELYFFQGLEYFIFKNRFALS